MVKLMGTLIAIAALATGCSMLSFDKRAKSSDGNPAGTDSNGQDATQATIDNADKVVGKTFTATYYTPEECDKKLKEMAADTQPNGIAQAGFRCHESLTFSKNDKGAQTVMVLELDIAEVYPWKLIGHTLTIGERRTYKMTADFSSFDRAEAADSKYPFILNK